MKEQKLDFRLIFRLCYEILEAREKLEQSMTHRYVWKRLPGRHNQPCRILVAKRNRMGSVLIQFSDGSKACTSINAIRRLK